MQKRNMYSLLLALTAGLLILVLGIAVVQQIAADPIGYIQFRETVRAMELKPWYDDADDVWNLFLPAYAGEEDVSITAQPGVTWTLEDGLLRVTTPFRSAQYRIQLRQSTNLPTLSLDAEEGVLEYIHANQNHEKDVFVTVTDAGGNALVQQMATISGRGNGTWGGNKRPYNLNFSSKLSVGPFEDISKFCLLAEVYDESKLRNSTVYFAGRELGIPYTSGYMHCNVYINGEYRGLYGMTTKQEYEKYIQQDDIQGVFEYTFYPKENQFYTFPSLDSFRVLYGNMDRIQEVVNYAYDAILSQDWERCAGVLDFASFAQKYAFDEFFANEDLGLASQYYYLDGNNMIHAMLPWDYDWSMGSSNRYFDSPQIQDIHANRFPDFWVTALLESEAFREEVVKSVEQSFTQDLFDRIDANMDGQIAWISDSLEWDTLRWDREDIYNLYPGTPDQAHLYDLWEQYSRYYPARRDFLIDYYRSRDTYCSVSFQMERYPAFYVPKGTPIAEILEQSCVWERRNLGVDVKSWHTETGLTPEKVGTVEGDVVFIPTLGNEVPVMPEAAPVTVPVLNRPWLKWTILGSLVAMLVLLTGTDILRQRMGRKKKDEVAV